MNTFKSCRFPLWLALAACLAACTPAANGGKAALDTPLASGQARLVMYYPDKIVGSDGRLQMDFGAGTFCQLDSGSYMVKDVPAGERTVAISFCGMPAVSYLKLEAKAGERYYIRIRPYDSSLSGIISGYPGEYVPAGSTAHKGPLLLERQEEQGALTALEGMRFSADWPH